MLYVVRTYVVEFTLRGIVCKLRVSDEKLVNLIDVLHFNRSEKIMIVLEDDKFLNNQVRITFTES